MTVLSCFEPRKISKKFGKDTSEKQADFGRKSVVEADEEFGLLISVVQLDIEQSADGVVK